MVLIFNPNKLNIEMGGDGASLELPYTLTELENMTISGFTLVIIQIVPITNLSMMLGAAYDEVPQSDKPVDPEHRNSRPIERIALKEERRFPTVALKNK